MSPYLSFGPGTLYINEEFIGEITMESPRVGCLYPRTAVNPHLEKVFKECDEEFKSVYIRPAARGCGKTQLQLALNDVLSKFGFKVHTVRKEEKNMPVEKREETNAILNTLNTSEIFWRNPDLTTVERKNICNKPHLPEIKDVIFNDPATIVFWKDGTKTVVKANHGDTFDPEKGLAMAISKKVLGNKYEYYGKFQKLVKKGLRK